MQLRAAVEADLQSFFELDQICFPDGIAYSLGEFRSLLRSKNIISVVAEEYAALAGFAMAEVGRLQRSLGGHIVTIDVAPEFRRRGVGRLLMGYIEAQVRDAGAGWLRLEVAVNNAAAMSFYAGLGFEGIGQILNYYQNSIDAIVMEKRLLARSAVML